MDRCIDRISVIPEGGRLKLEIKVFTCGTIDKYHTDLRNRTGHTFKTLFEKWRGIGMKQSSLPEHTRGSIPRSLNAEKAATRRRSNIFQTRFRREFYNLKRHIFSTALALLLCVSLVPNVYALPEESQPPENQPAEISGAQPEPDADPELYGEPEPYAEAADVLTPQGVLAAMTALKAKYPDGTPWTDHTPYDDGNYYHWKGGPLGGKNIVAVGCVAFAFLLSDEAFGTLPARMYDPGQFSFSDIKSGDILRLNGGAHTVIVLEVIDGEGVVIAEGNNSGKVLWGRTLSKDEITQNASNYITRYPEGYVPPDDPSAGEEIGSGKAGALSWTLTKAGVLTLSGSGAVPDYSINTEQPWAEWAGQIRQIVLEEGITAIGSCAFQMVSAYSAAIPNSVTSIGSNAFQNSSLVSVSIPASVKTIGDSAFKDCSRLASAAISDGVETIAPNAFRSCTSLASIELPASVRSVGDSAFMSCEAMTTAKFASSGTKVVLGEYLFLQCWRLAFVTLPSNTEAITKGMFQSCPMLSSLVIPQGVTKISEAAFTSTSLAYLAIPKSMTYIFPWVFMNLPLNSVYYEGSEAEWNRISGLAQNPALANAEKVYNFDYSGGSDSWEVQSWSKDRVVFQDPVAENAFIFAVRHNNGRMIQAAQGSANENTVTFTGMTLTEGDALLVLNQDGLTPLTDKTVLK